MLQPCKKYNILIRTKINTHRIPVLFIENLFPPDDIFAIVFYTKIGVFMDEYESG